MIKFIIGLIAVVFIALTGYMFVSSEKKAEQTVTKLHRIEDSKTSVDVSSLKSMDTNTALKVKSMENNTNESKFTYSHKDEKETLGEDEKILLFEQSVANDFSNKNTYTGKIYGIDDYDSSEDANSYEEIKDNDGVAESSTEENYISNSEESEEISSFEQSIADDYARKSNYSGKIYGIDEYDSESSSSSSEEKLDNERSSSLGEWEKEEILMDNH